MRVITRLNIGGPSIQAVNLSDRLRERGYATTLLHGRLGPGEGDMSYLLDGRAIDARYLPELLRAVSPASDLAATRLVYRVLCEVRPAIVHTHMAKAGAVGRVAAWLYNRTAGRRAPARVVHTYHGHVLEGYFSARKTALFIRAEQALARVTDRLVAISPRIREELLEAYQIGRPGQYAVVPLGFDLDVFARVDAAHRAAARAALGVQPRDLVVSTVGRLTAIKQHHLFLEMAARVAAAEPRAQFLVAGDGELRAALEADARARGLEASVRFLGWRRDLDVIYGATDVFALTSRNEGTPVALIEAMASGVPGVSTDVGGVGDVLVDEATGLRVPDGDVGALSDAVLRVLRAPDREAMGARARASVLRRYGMQRLVEDVVGLYESLLV